MNPYYAAMPSKKQTRNNGFPSGNGGFRRFHSTAACGSYDMQAFGGGSYREGTEVEIAAVAYEGYMFEKWTDSNTQNPPSR